MLSIYEQIYSCPHSGESLQILFVCLLFCYLYKYTRVLYILKTFLNIHKVTVIISEY